MSLAEKIFKSMKPGCGIRSECRTNSDRKFFSDLFAEDWDVFVIRHDKTKGKYDWFTQCCEAVNELCNAKSVEAACC